MNSATGTMVGITGGAVGAPNNNAGAHPSIANATQDVLNTYIYDYLCRQEHWDLARQFSEFCPIKKLPKGKKEPNGDSDMDSKLENKRPDDLPVPNLPPHYSESGFLFDWWCQFWDIFGAARSRGSTGPSSQYLNFTSAQAKMKSNVQAGIMSNGNNSFIPRPPQYPQNMQQAMAKHNLNRAGMQQNVAKMQQNNEGEQQPRSPGSMNAHSPSKRLRLDDGTFNGQAGRGQPIGAQMGNMPGAPNGAMMLQNGMPHEMTQQMNAFGQMQNGQQKLEMGTPQPGMENAFEMMGAQRQMANGGANSSQGNHALQDYQMQLMLLEQQNKKRLLMARQEQDNVNHVPGSAGSPGGSQPQGQINIPGQPNPAMSSPGNGRVGPSPNPNEQAKRMASQKMAAGNLPGSPMPGDFNRGSPVPGFEQNGMNPAMRQAMFAQQQQNMMGQPPGSHPGFQQMQMATMPQQGMNEQQMRMAAAQGRLPNGQPWQGQMPPQMMQPGAVQAQIGTPQQRNAMPPPPAPPAAEQQQRTQPSSPAQQPNPPTPSQAPKSAPKGKKETAKKKAAAKKDNSAATPAASDAPPATPTASTPITPMPNASFGGKAGANAIAGGPAAGPAQSALVMAVDPTGNVPFGDLTGNGGDQFNLDFAADGPDVLESFDFDSFLHNTDDANGYGFDLMNFAPMDGTEASTGS